MQKFIFITVISLVLLTACSWNRSGKPEDSGPEAFFRGNLNRTGVYPSTAVTKPTTPSWQFQTGEWVATAPAVVENIVYFGSYDGNLYAVDASTGAEIWRFAMNNNPVLSSPAVSGDLVFVGGMNGTLYALDRKTGVNRWQFGTRGSILASPAVANGLVYVGSEDGLMYAINVNNGQEAWHVEVGAPIPYDAAVADGLLIFGDVAGKLTAVKAINGEPAWQLQIGEGSVTSGAAIGDGFAAILLTNSSQQGTLVAVDLETQAVRWQYSLGVESYSAPVVWQNFVIVADLSGKVTAVDQNSAAVQWQFLAQDLIFSAPVVAENVLYFGSLDKNLYAVDAQTGQEIWRFPLGGGVASPAVFDGVLYVGTDKGLVYAIPGSE